MNEVYKYNKYIIREYLWNIQENKEYECKQNKIYLKK